MRTFLAGGACSCSSSRGSSGSSSGSGLAGLRPFKTFLGAASAAGSSSADAATLRSDSFLTNAMVLFFVVVAPLLIERRGLQ